MILGHDDAIMKYCLVTMGTWTPPDRSKPLIPKDEGMGLMFSAFTCRDLGFGCIIPEDVLARVNIKRQNTKYSDTMATKLANGKAEKHPIKTSPFIRTLEYGQNKYEYWSYDHTTIQLEDCIDVLKCQFPDSNFIFFMTANNLPN